jgi:hypothetical protein
MFLSLKKPSKVKIRRLRYIFLKSRHVAHVLSVCHEAINSCNLQQFWFLSTCRHHFLFKSPFSHISPSYLISYSSRALAKHMKICRHKTNTYCSKSVRGMTTISRFVLFSVLIIVKTLFITL